MLNTKIKTPSLFLLLCLLGFPQISETIYTPSLPDLARNLGIEVAIAEYTLSIYFMGFAFGVFAFGILADLIGRKKSMLIGIFIYLMSSLGCAFCSSIDILLVMRFVQAFGAAVGSVVTQTILRDLYTGTERNRVFAIAAGALAFSPALGPVVGGIVDQVWGWRANFFVLASIGCVLWFSSLVRLVETQIVPSSFTRADFLDLVKKMIVDPNLYFYAFLIGGCNGIIFSYYAEAPFIFIELLGLSPSQYGFLGLIIAASFFLASFLSIKLNSRMHTYGTLAVGASISFFGSLSLWTVCRVSHLLPEIEIRVWFSLIASLFLIFIGIGIVIPNCLSQALTHYQSRSGMAGSIFGFAYYWIISGFTALMGVIHNGTSQAMPIYFCFIMGIILILSLYRYAQLLFHKVVL